MINRAVFLTKGFDAGLLATLIGPHGDGPLVDKVKSFGIAADKPVTGIW